ncbi:ABC transporter substrate-binding protein [Kineosporia sp. NBRC 101677]|uniref:ABC transporter substrate-binding protein n=1 Tax=Kineosporia sp. NBRC 101677 TaxID=3032197 RepID=UPI00249FB947|nr:ABC transporter substrate-binding protein [Kineosporia sp. NBRC 101677]GLY15836.1 ABC transporter substrate-binding protein [Kineosporia sp. NBRC 101677]
MSLSRRSFLLGTGLVALNLSGCGDSGEAESSQELTFWYWEGALSAAVVKDVSAKFADRARISTSLVGGDFAQRLSTSLRAGEAVPDISGVKGEDMAFFQTQADYFLDLNTLGAEDIAGTFVAAKFAQATTDDGRQIGLPIDLGPTALFLREDLWRKAGLSVEISEVSEKMADWDGWFDTAHELKSRLPGTFAIRNSNDVFGVALAQQTKTFVDRTGAFVGDQDEVRSAWEKAVQAIVDGLQAGIYDDTAFGTALTSGTLTGHLGPAWNGLDIASAAPSTSGRWRVAACPGGPGNIGGSYLAIPARSRDPETAFAYIAELLSAANEARAFTDSSVFPAVTAAYDLPALTEGQKFFGGQSTIEVFGPAAEQLPIVYESPLNAAALTSYYSELANIEGGKAPAQAWKDAVEAGRRTVEAGQ